jgi:ring-1,2-phenylacetyl-CoA epoxidase subunit PaaC
LSCFHFFQYRQLEQSKDLRLAAVAEKAIKESAYHLRWSSEWVIRLGDGTVESHNRMVGALDYLWPYTAELFQQAPYETEGVLLGYFDDINRIRPLWEEKLGSVFAEATLLLPASTWAIGGGKTGKHTEHLSYLLGEMQSLQRAYPGNAW